MPSQNTGGKSWDLCGWATYNTRQRLDIFTSEEQDILKDVEPIMQNIKRIMQQSGYSDGGPLATKDQTFALENVFKHHPDKAAKMVAGIDCVMVSFSSFSLLFNLLDLQFIINTTGLIDLTLLPKPKGFALNDDFYGCFFSSIYVQVHMHIRLYVLMHCVGISLLWRSFLGISFLGFLGHKWLGIQSILFLYD